MGKRRKQESLADVLVIRAWWLSALMGSIAYAAMRWVVPATFAKNPLLVDLATISRSFAWLPLLGFGCVALISIIRTKMEEAHENDRRERRTRRSWRDTSANMSRLRFKHGWGVTRQGALTTISKPKQQVFNTWTLGALRALEWKRFESLCVKYFEINGFQSQTTRCGTDGSFDMKLYKTDPGQPLAVLQCKSWNVYTVGAKEVRELLALMAKEKADRAIYLTTGTFTKDALTVAGDHPLQLLDGDGFLRKIQALPQNKQDALLKQTFEGDFRTPTCPSCGIKMTTRAGENGPCWGCINSPRCKSVFVVKA